MKTIFKTLGSLMMMVVLFSPCKSMAAGYDYEDYSAFAMSSFFSFEERPHLVFENNILYIEDFDSDEIEIILCDPIGQILATSHSSSIDLSNFTSGKYCARERYSGAGLMFYKR